MLEQCELTVEHPFRSQIVDVLGDGYDSCDSTENIAAAAAKASMARVNDYLDEASADERQRYRRIITFRLDTRNNGVPFLPNTTTDSSVETFTEPEGINGEGHFDAMSAAE